MEHGPRGRSQTRNTTEQRSLRGKDGARPQKPKPKREYNRRSEKDGGSKAQVVEPPIESLRSTRYVLYQGKISTHKKKEKLLRRRRRRPQKRGTNEMRKGERGTWREKFKE